MTDTAMTHPWLPRTSCTAECVRAGLGKPGHPGIAAIRCALRVTLTALTFMTLPILALPLPGRSRIQRIYCRIVLRCMGIRFAQSGGPIREVPGILVVSNHVSWIDVFAVGAVIPGSFVARADLIDWPAVGLAARMANVIPIDRGKLRQLPDVLAEVGARLRQGHTVVAFPEGTTHCGVDSGRFRPAVFQAAIDSARPVQPLRLSYHHPDGTPSTATAFLGEDSLWASVKRIARARQTLVHVQVRPLQLPQPTRSRLSVACEAAVLAEAS